ncbi:MAG: hypothetical protein AB1553_00605 [Nitrospirota bacterium]
MRDLGKADNKVTFRDGISGSKITLFYRTPTTEELQEYYSNSMIRKQGKTIANAVNARVDFAEKILTGIGEGCFGINKKPISSNPESPDYKENWKALVKESAPDILDTFIIMTFERSSIQAVLTEGDGGEEELPLSKSSEG